MIVIIISFIAINQLTNAILATNFSARTMQLIMSSLFFILLFISGIVVPKEQLPSMLQGVINYSPIYVTFQVLDSIWNNSHSMSWIVRSLSITVIFGIIFYIIARILERYNKKNG
jgi:ABC-2 type transport system permease protein